MEKKGTRKIDELGRIVIPADVRKSLEINVGDFVEFFVDYSQNSVIIKKYSSSCVFCGSHSKLNNFNEKSICSDCISKISNLG